MIYSITCNFGTVREEGAGYTLNYGQEGEYAIAKSRQTEESLPWRKYA